MEPEPVFQSEHHESTGAFPAPSPAANRLKATLRRRLDSFVGTLAVLEGRASLREPVTGRTREAMAGIRVSSETRLRVTTGRALVRLDDGSDLWISAGSMVDFSSWGPRVRGLRLATGRVLALVAPEPGRSFRIAGAAGEVRAVGTAFAVAAHGRSLDVAVFHGTIEFSNGAGSVRAGRGKRVESSGRSTPVRMGRLSTAGDEWTWARDLGASGGNAAIRTAYETTRGSFRLSDGPAPAASGGGGRRLRPVWWILLVALIASGWWLWRRADAPSGRGGVATERADSPAPMVFDEKTPPKELEEMLSKLPPDVAEEMRKQIKENGGKGMVQWRADNGKGPEDGKVFRRVIKGPGGGELPPGAQDLHVETGEQIKAAQQTMMDLIKAGVPPDKAAEAVGRGMSDSLTKEIQQKNPNAKAEVRFQVDPQTGGDSAGYRIKTQMSVMRDDPPPPMPPGPGATPSGPNSPPDSSTSEAAP